MVAYAPHSTSRLAVHSLTFDDDEPLPTSGSLEIGIMTYRTDGTKKVNFVKKIDTQNLTAHTITMEGTVRMVVVQESFRTSTKTFLPFTGCYERISQTVAK